MWVFVNTSKKYPAHTHTLSLILDTKIDLKKRFKINSLLFQALKIKIILLPTKKEKRKKKKTIFF